MREGFEYNYQDLCLIDGEKEITAVYKSSKNDPVAIMDLLIPPPFHLLSSVCKS